MEKRKAHHGKREKKEEDIPKGKAQEFDIRNIKDQGRKRRPANGRI